ncbi:MAG: M23 family metallopeptidase [Alphaproteobacteria bacterium]|nr:M23 family metallopeptidase [Alphaproteobacteria bacterium]
MPKASIFVLTTIITATAFADGFLTASKFPKTFDDLSFVDQMEVLREGYAEEIVYDQSGKCISGCHAYNSISIEQDIERMADATTRANRIIMDAIAENNSTTPPSETSSGPNTSVKAPQPEQPTTPHQPGNNTKLNGIPLGSPIHTNNLIITSDFGMRTLDGGKTYRMHPAIDIGVPDGTPVYTPASGTVTRVWWDNYGGGNVIEIEHSHGFRTKYLHLSQQLVKAGQQVNRGDLIGKSGHSGGNYGPHLDYRVLFNDMYIDILCPCFMFHKDGGQQQKIQQRCNYNLLQSNYTMDNSNRRTEYRIKHSYCLSKPSDKLPGQK